MRVETKGATPLWVLRLCVPANRAVLVVQGVGGLSPSGEAEVVKVLVAFWLLRVWRLAVAWR